MIDLAKTLKTEEITSITGTMGTPGVEDGGINPLDVLKLHH